VAYQWICGGVSMNYHTLSDFRVAHVELMDRILSTGVTALVAEGVVQLQRLAQDGVRVRAAAGAGSYRRRRRLEKLLAEAEVRVAALKEELQTDPAASTARPTGGTPAGGTRTGAADDGRAGADEGTGGGAGTAREDAQAGYPETKRTAGLDHRRRSAGHEDGRRRLSSGL
jgi:hypothetical protein